MTMVNILEKFDEDELVLMMNDHKQGWEGHEMKSESPKQQQQVQKVNRQVFGNNSAAFPEKFLFFPAGTMVWADILPVYF